MNVASKISPLKRKKAVAAAPTVKPRPLLELGLAGWPCPGFDACPDGFFKSPREGKQGVLCDLLQQRLEGRHNVQDNAVLSTAQLHSSLPPSWYASFYLSPLPKTLFVSSSSTEFRGGTSLLRPEP